ncbi:MAG: hypothetical protein WCP33_06090 [Deltaproteobacteria bacterium]
MFVQPLTILLCTGSAPGPWGQRITPESLKRESFEQRKQKLIEKFDLVVEILGYSGKDQARLIEWLAKDGVLDVYQDLVEVGQINKAG